MVNIDSLRTLTFRELLPLALAECDDPETDAKTLLAALVEMRANCWQFRPFVSDGLAPRAISETDARDADAKTFEALILQLPREKANRLKAAAARCAMRHPDVFLNSPPAPTSHLRLAQD